MTSRSYRSHNYPLLIGGILSAVIVLLAIVGPSLAPHDPLQEAGLIQVDGVYYGPPPFPRQLPPFRSADYPLGHDDISRDVLSRLLWAVRPTLILCAVVMAARLVIGVALGLAAGWYGGWPARIVDRLTSLSVALPLLAFAIGAIIALGLQRGLITFVVALTLTGWNDTAALVKARTEAVRGAPFIESARAIGIGQRGILWRHVLPQIVPLLPMLAAFELSAVLLVVAELGYLGYYIGGGYSFRYTVNNFDEHFLIRTGMPELGQMLGDFWGQLYRTPWVSLAAGSIVAVALLGFALLGEGLRRRVDVTRPRHRWRVWRSDRATAPVAPRRWVWLWLGIAAISIGLVALIGRALQLRAPAQAIDGPADAGASPSVRAVSITPVPSDQLATIDLDGTVLQQGDLPRSFETFQITDRPPFVLSRAPQPERAINLALKRGDVNSGTATILLYATTNERDDAYDLVYERNSAALPTFRGNARQGGDWTAPTPIPPDSVPDLGERSFVTEGHTFGVAAGNIGFTRCAAIVYINLTGSQDEPLTQLAQDYARRIDARLAPLVCEPL